MDQHQSSVPKKQAPHLSSDSSGKTPRDDTLQDTTSPRTVDIIAMVRSLQRMAGMADCFRRGNVDCDIIDCDWRSHCLEALPPKK